MFAGLDPGDRFTIVRKLGAGGMGVVFEAFDEHHKRRVALKTLAHFSNRRAVDTQDARKGTLVRADPAAVYEIKNEFRAVAEVHHENLVRLHELFGSDQLWFFTMELVEGEPFDRWVRPNGALDEKRLRGALRQLASGIFAVHAAGKLHRDLKPSNVLVTADGRVVVLDFGLAIEPELAGIRNTITEPGLMGTPAYMAPEQFAGAAASSASDLYAFGVMLFEALTGRLPFHGRPHELQRREAPLASTLAGDLPADLCALCAEILRSDPAARPGRAEILSRLGSPVPHAPERAEVPLAPSAASDLLGRDGDLVALRDAFEVTRVERAVVLCVSGESGIGKSALVWTLVRDLRAAGRATVLTGRCYERENVPYKGFDALVDDVSRHLRRLPEEEAEALLPREVYALARIFPVLNRVPVVARAPTKTVPDPQDLKRRAFDAFAELLGRMRSGAPLVVLIDDLQWIDRDSAQFLRALLLQPNPAPILLLFTYRSERAEDNARLQTVLDAARQAGLDLRLRELGPLPPQAAVAIVQRLLPLGTDSAVSEALAAESNGSPYFAAVLGRAVAASGIQSLGSALSLDLALTRQVELLPPECRRLLSVMALAGQPLEPRLVIEAGGIGQGHDALDRLREERLARVAIQEEGERIVECYHDRVRESVAAGLTPDGSRDLAAGLAQVLIGEAGSDPELIARMLELAGMAEQAAEHLARAAERAWASLAFDRAADLIARALERGNFDGARLRSLRTRRAEALSHSGRGERAAEAFLAAAEGASNDEAHELERRAGEQHLMCGDLVQGRALLGRSLKRVGISFPGTLPAALASMAWSRTRLRLRGLEFVARERQDIADLRELDALRTAAHGLVRTDPLRSADFSARWLTRALDAGHTIEIGRALGWELLFAGMMAAPDAKLAELEASCDRINRRTRDWMSAYVTVFARGWTAMIRRGDAAGALSCFDEALEILNRNPSPTSSYDRAWLQSFRAMSNFLCCRLDRCGEIAHAHMEEAEVRGDYPVVANFIQAACYAAIGAGRLDHCRDMLARAATRLRAGEETIQDFMWLSTQPLPALYRGDARGAFREAAAHRERFLQSFVGRFMLAGMLENEACGLAAAAAQHAETPAERRHLERLARRYARRAQSARSAAGTGAPGAVLACLDGDRVGAIAALRLRLMEPLAPVAAQVTRRRLGELVGGDEGRDLLGTADLALREGGVVDPARYTAAMVPGVELAGASPARR